MLAFVSDIHSNIEALTAVLAEPAGRTRDLGGTATTTSFAEAICAVL